MGTKWKKAELGVVLLLFVVSILAWLPGCARVQKTVGSATNVLKGTQTDQQLESRENAVRRYKYKSTRNELFLEVPVVSPKIVKPGETLNQTVQFGLLSPRVEKTFYVIEVITLTGGDLVVELLKKDSEKNQGIHATTLQFTIPKDLPQGRYTVVTNILADNIKAWKTVSFRVKR